MSNSSRDCNNWGDKREFFEMHWFINTGTRPLIPSVPGLKEAGFLTSESIMGLEQLPEHLIVLGSGYIGLEFAQLFRRFGSCVTVIGHSEQILSQQDPDIAFAVQTVLERDGIDFLLKAKVDPSDNATKHQIQGADREMELQCSHLRVAVGCAPTTNTLNLAAARVATGERGFIQVTDRLETNVLEI